MYETKINDMPALFYETYAHVKHYECLVYLDLVI